MILVPGRNAISLVVPRSPRTALVSALVMPLLTGAVAQHYVSSHDDSARRVALASLSSTRLPPAATTTHVSAARAEPELEPIGRSPLRGLPPMAADTRVTKTPAPRPPAEMPAVHLEPRAAEPLAIALFGVTHAAFNGALPMLALAHTEPAQAPMPVAGAPEASGATRAAFNGALPALASIRFEGAALPESAAAVSGKLPEPAADRDGADNPAVIDVKTILRALKSRRNATSDAEVQSIPKTGTLELQALHLGETISVRPFDDQLQPNPDALAAIDHVMRCRITGTVIPIDPRLVEILVQLHTLYGKPIELVSGHRQPLTIGTKKTSQHALGRAADIRIPGVGIEELKRVAMRLGARGIGLYPEKGFVHVDVRQKPRYFWSYMAASGELADGRAPVRPPTAAASSESATETPSEPESGEDAESTATDTAAAEQHADDSL